MTATAPRGVELEAQSRADVDAVKPVDLLPSTQNPLYLPARGLSFQGVFGRLFFHHLSKLVQVGYARRLEPADLYAAKELKIDEVRDGSVRLLACSLPPQRAARAMRTCCAAHRGARGH